MKSLWKKTAVAAIILVLASTAYFHFADNGASNALQPETSCVAAGNIENTEKNKRTDKKDFTIRAFLNAVLVLIKAVSVFILSACLKIITGLIAAALSKGFSGPLHFILTFIFDALIFFVLIFLLFGILYKKLYPERKLIRLYTKKNILRMLAAAAVLAALKAAAGFFMHKLHIFATAAQCFAVLLVLCLLWYKINGMRCGLNKSYKAALTSRTGKLLTAGLAAWTILSAALKIGIEKSALIRNCADLASVFCLCLGIAFCICKINRINSLLSGR